MQLGTPQRTLKKSACKAWGNIENQTVRWSEWPILANISGQRLLSLKICEEYQERTCAKVIKDSAKKIAAGLWDK